MTSRQRVPSRSNRCIGCTGGFSEIRYEVRRPSQLSASHKAFHPFTGPPELLGGQLSTMPRRDGWAYLIAQQASGFIIAPIHDPSTTFLRELLQSTPPRADGISTYLAPAAASETARWMATAAPSL